MSEKKQIAEAKVKRQRKAETPVARAPGRAAGLPAGPEGAALHGSDVGAQAAMLQGMPAAQRQAAIHQISRMQGNQHVSRLIAAMRQGGAAAHIQRAGQEQTELIQPSFWGKIGAGIKSAAQAVGGAAEWTGNKIAEGAKWTGGKIASGAKTVANVFHNGAYRDLNTTQYRITSKKIELVKRVERRDGSVGYLAVGEVKDFEGNRPRVVMYAQPLDLKDWAPQVTHINGMNVNPQGGIKDAQALHGAMVSSLKGSGEVTLNESEEQKLAVLYTYSATRGFGHDLVECLAGKVGLDDEATQNQETLMLDAVRHKRRTTVSAHSRGTIKTDNAVRNVHKQLSSGYMRLTYNGPEAHLAAEEARKFAVTHGSAPDLDPDMLAEIARMVKARQLADEKASGEMDKYIHLIYAGNAVQFPSQAVQLNLVVAKGDPITILVGKYAKFAAAKNVKMTKVSGGHGFDENYAKKVGELIIADMASR